MTSPSITMKKAVTDANDAVTDAMCRSSTMSFNSSGSRSRSHSEDLETARRLSQGKVKLRTSAMDILAAYTDDTNYHGTQNGDGMTVTMNGVGAPLSPPPDHSPYLANGERRRRASFSMDDITERPGSLNDSKARRGSGSHTTGMEQSKIFDTPAVVAAYDSVPTIDVEVLPRGGVSLDTEAVGRIQFGLPPETIKDSMQLGLTVPSVYIVPMERFCRDMGPALGVNLAEFEFPAYFNYFVHGKQCTLIVDNKDAEDNIRKVFEETLLGPAEFRRKTRPTRSRDEDFAPDYPYAARPDFHKEFDWFRKNEATEHFDELQLDMLLKFTHFQKAGRSIERLGAPPCIDHTRHSCKDDNERKINIKDDNCLGSEEQSLDDRETSIRKSQSTSNLMSLSNHGTGSCHESEFLAKNITQSPVPKRATFAVNSEYIQKKTVRHLRKSSGSRSANLHLPDWSDDEEEPFKWSFSQAKWLGEPAVVYPHNITDEEKNSHSTRRVEIFKMPGGSDYIIHDIDENNNIIGKACISGNVHIPESIAVVGYPVLSEFDNSSKSSESSDELHSANDEIDNILESQLFNPETVPTFHAPSFGVTVLGNAHGFDKSGSTSGYVLWVNGRGVMVDPPPYASATLEREGIRPNMIIAIIVTHCHADHDAGAFQKVLTGSKVAIITTPTIYKSFIRKYAALSALSPALLMHCHRFRPAIIGEALRFQGATFHFTYTLHTIPCIAFRVEWRNKSIVFSGDHLNSPPIISDLVEKEILSNERAESLRNIPLQDTDILLHESGAPPIHTPLKVLQELPQKVKDRLYVVHTSALSADSELRVAPTGTAGTIRLDEISSPTTQTSKADALEEKESVSITHDKETYPNRVDEIIQDDYDNEPSTLCCWSRKNDKRKQRLSKQAITKECQCSMINEVGQETKDLLTTQPSEEKIDATSRISEIGYNCDTCGVPHIENEAQIPAVALRPTCVSDAWFMLNLLSAIPFFSSLAFGCTMEVLEIARVDMFSMGDIVVPAASRPFYLCVVWEGTLIEKAKKGTSCPFKPDMDSDDVTDIPAVWHAGDWTGPISLQPNKVMSCESGPRSQTCDIIATSESGVKVIFLSLSDLHTILIKSGSGLYRKAIQNHKSLPITSAYSSVIGTSKRNFDINASLHGDLLLSDRSLQALHTRSSFIDVLNCNSSLRKLSPLQKNHLEAIADPPQRLSAGANVWSVGQPVVNAFLIVRGSIKFAHHRLHTVTQRRSSMNSDMSTIEMPGLRRNQSSETPKSNLKRNQSADNMEPLNERHDKQLLDISRTSEYGRLETILTRRAKQFDSRIENLAEDTLWNVIKGRFANKVLGRLYSRRAYTSGLVFCRGGFLCDVSKIMSGSVSAGKEGDFVATEIGSHTSNLVAGEKGCTVIPIPKDRLVSFLDDNPGVLLSLLGTQITL